jgi:hypothetical protein
MKYELNLEVDAIQFDGDVEIVMDFLQRYQSTVWYALYLNKEICTFENANKTEMLSILKGQWLAYYSGYYLILNEREFNECVVKEPDMVYAFTNSGQKWVEKE